MKTRTKIGLGGTALVVAGAAGGAWWYLRDDAPPPVDLETAVAQVETTSAATASAIDGTTASTTDTTTAAVTAGIDGTWTVDTETGTFDYETATGTFVGFRIAEELASIGETTAVGRTGEVAGSITIEGTTLTAATFDVDIATLTTNDSRRDDEVAEALDSSQYPTATFTLTEPVDLGDAATSGQAVSVTAVGELTIHGATQAVEIPLEAQLVDDTVVVVGSVDVVFSDYGVEVPSAPIVLSVEDQGTIEMQLLLAEA